MSMPIRFLIEAYHKRNAELNQPAHWFDRNTMRFFKTRLSRSWSGDYLFTTAETDPSGCTRYSVRQFDEATGSIKTIGTFHSYKTRKAAEQAKRLYAEVNA